MLPEKNAFRLERNWNIEGKNILKYYAISYVYMAIM